MSILTIRVFFRPGGILWYEYGIQKLTKIVIISKNSFKLSHKAFHNPKHSRFGLLFKLEKQNKKNMLFNTFYELNRVSFFVNIIKPLKLK